MMGHQPRLTLAVADLLPPVRRNGRAVVMPDERGARKPDPPAPRLQPPAHVHVVAGAQVDRIETADREERLAAKRHVAARHVLGDAVVEQHVRRSPGGARDALRHRGIVVGYDIGSARADDVRGEEGPDEIRQPVAIDADVRVGVRDDLAAGPGETAVARGAEPPVRCLDEAHLRMPARDLSRAVLRPVVDEDDLVIGIHQPLQRGEAVFERVGGVVRAHDDRDPRPRLPHLGWKRGIGKGRGDGDRRGLRVAVAIDEPERPVVHLVAAAPPIIRPCECHRTARAFLERRADVHRGDVGLPRFALPDAIRAGFGEQQRLVTGDVLEAYEVRPQLGFAVQIDVEGADVEEREIEKLGRRIVDVGEQAARRPRLCGVIQVAEEILDPQATVPADHAGRNLVAESKGERCRVIGECTNLTDDLLPDAAREPSIVQKRGVLRPRKPDHHAEPLTGRLVQQVPPGGRVSPDRIDAEPRHHAEVLGELETRGKLVAVGVGSKRPVRHSLDEKADSVRRLRARELGAQKFSVRNDPRGQFPRRVRSEAGIRLNCSPHNTSWPLELGKRQLSIVSGGRGWRLEVRGQGLGVRD